MQLDNDKLVVGDQVYDFIDGYGKVSTIGGSRFTVDFGRNKIIPYNSAGVRLAEKPTRLGRTLYWENPANYFIPRKEPAANALAREVGVAVSNYLANQ